MFGWFQSLAALAAGRSSKWPALRAAHLKVQPECQFCGADEEIEVHHVVPVFRCAEMELDSTNLISMCRPCHYAVGHLSSWQSFNVTVREDCRKWQIRRKNRP